MTLGGELNPIDIQRQAGEHLLSKAYSEIGLRLYMLLSGGNQEKKVFVNTLKTAYKTSEELKELTKSGMLTDKTVTQRIGLNSKIYDNDLLLLPDDKFLELCGNQDPGGVDLVRRFRAEINQRMQDVLTADFEIPEKDQEGWAEAFGLAYNLYREMKYRIVDDTSLLNFESNICSYVGPRSLGIRLFLFDLLKTRNTKKKPEWSNGSRKYLFQTTLEPLKMVHIMKGSGKADESFHTIKIVGSKQAKLHGL